MNGEMDGKVNMSRQSRVFAFVIILLELLKPICNMTWRVNNYASCHGEGINGRNESTSRILINTNIHCCSKKHFPD